MNTADLPLIELRGAGVRYGARTALAGVDLGVARGDFVAVVGANGAGKTTLLRALHGLVPLSSGERTQSLQGTGLRIAMLFQRPFLVRVSVRANVELTLWLAGVARRERRARAMEALERVGLAALAGRPARELSIGQQQRVALARAWALQPDVLLLDEPTASLDPGATREVESLIAQIAARGIAVLMTSHNLGQVRRLAHRVVYLEEGRVHTDVTALRFFDGPLPTAATRFLQAEVPWG
jgi:tungstate transport system ATP-binding protein